ARARGPAGHHRLGRLDRAGRGGDGRRIRLRRLLQPGHVPDRQRARAAPGRARSQGRERDRALRPAPPGAATHPAHRDGRALPGHGLRTRRALRGRLPWRRPEFPPVKRRRIGRSLKPLRFPWAWCALWCLAVAAVVVFTLMPAPDLPDAPGSDMLHRFLAYFLLAASAVQLFARWPSLLGAGLGLVLLGIGLEHVQGTTDTRFADRWDALANTL